ncbi:MAG: hypothetical protein NVS1B9_12390 [Solirubrobacteraceae bacterium]
MKRLRLAAVVGLLAGGIRLLLGPGLINYDTLYAMVWGRDLAHGTLPDYSVSIAPTPHPLATAASVLLAPLSTHGVHGVHGEAASSLVLAAAFVALALLGTVVFELGREWINTPAGILAAAIVLTRQPVLDFGARAYVDIPYLVLVLSALLLETRRPRAGLPVLALLAVAGLLRPEAWLLSGAYWLWLWRSGVPGVARLAACAAAGPLLWCLGDLALTGDPLHSLTGTRHTARVLGRVTGIGHVPVTMPRRLGEILREPVLYGASVGIALSWLWLRRRAVKLASASGLAALAAFILLAGAGLPIIARYLLLPAVLLAIFCGAGAFGWLELEPGDPRRRRWVAAAATIGLALLIFLPGQASRLRTLRGTLATQHRIQSDLARLVRNGAVGRSCRPISVPNHRPVPLLALWLDIGPPAVLPFPHSSGTYITPASAAVATAYVLDKRDPVQAVAATPSGFAPAGADASWKVFSRCL